MVRARGFRLRRCLRDHRVIATARRCAASIGTVRLCLAGTALCPAAAALMIACVDVVAQWVRTSWTKHSRGGGAAARRNAAPVGFVLPTGRCPIVHTVIMDEADDLQPRESLRDGGPDDGDVVLKEVDGRLRVGLVGSPFGVPRRWWRPPAIWLQRGEWVRWQVNYRFSGSWGGAWSYRLDTFNLAYGPATVDLFTGRPSRYVDERARLR